MTDRDQLHQLEREISERVGQALGTLKERLEGFLRETHEAALEHLGGLEPELPDRFLDDRALEGLGGNAESSGRSAGFSELVRVLRSIDQASSQAAVLTALLDGSVTFANRAAFFLIRGDQVHGWGLRTASESLRSLSGTSFAATASWQAVATGAGATILSEAEREEIAEHLDGLTAEDAILIPFVLRDALAGVLYADGAASAEAALQMLVYVAAQAVEILPLRQRSETVTLMGPAAPQESPAEVEPVQEEAEEVEDEEAAHEIEAVADIAVEAEEEPEGEIEQAVAAEPELEEEEPETRATEEIAYEAAEDEVADEVEAVADEGSVEPEIEESIGFEETTEEIVTAGDGESAPAIDEPEETPIEDVSAGGWSLEDAAPTEAVDVLAAETAAVATQPPVEEEAAAESEALELEQPAEDPTWAEPAAVESEPEVPSLEVDSSPELDSTGPEEASLEPPTAPIPTGEETVLIQPPSLASLQEAVEVEPPAPEPEPEPEPMPSTQVGPPADMEPPPSTQVAPPPEESSAIESPLVTPPSDLDGPGAAFATTRVPIDAEQVQAHEEARRLARLLVSEIKLYNEEEVEEGRRTGDVYARLKDDIDRSRQMFVERIDPEVKESTDYFYQELVRILGGGDADALGM